MNDRRRMGIEKEISRVIGTALITDVKNDKISKNLSVKSVSLTKDGRYVDISFSILKLTKEINTEKLTEELGKLKGYFRKKIGDAINIRHTPEVRIHIDDTIEYSARISEILNKIKKEEE